MPMRSTPECSAVIECGATFEGGRCLSAVRRSVEQRRIEIEEMKKE
jgi:hypothetical protein